MGFDVLRPSTEQRIREIGKDILGRKRSWRFSPSAWWTSRLMAYSMGNETLKTQLFRLVDVLPVLDNGTKISRHLKEYLDVRGVPLAFRAIGKFAGIAPGFAEMVTNASARAMARSFIAGRNESEAHLEFLRLRKAGMSTTFDLLGESVVSQREADDFFSRYMDLFRDRRSATLVYQAMNKEWETRGWALPLTDRDADGRVPSFNVSIKLSSLYHQIDPIDPEGSYAGLAWKLAHMAWKASDEFAFLNVDMEDYRTKDFTLSTFKRMVDREEVRDHRHFGIVIQAYLKDAPKDIADLVSFAMRTGCRFTIRLVKGAYWDHEIATARQNGWPVPVFEDKASTDLNFEHCAGLILRAYPHVQGAFGTHNVRSVASVVAAAEGHRLPPEAYEFQGLYGMADDLKEALVGMGHRVRTYMPYGELLPGMAYLVRRLLENTSNESFIRRGKEGAGEEVLLARPRSAT